MAKLGSNKIAFKKDKYKIIFDIVFSYINFLNKIIPNIVKDELMRESIEKKR